MPCTVRVTPSSRATRAARRTSAHMRSLRRPCSAAECCSLVRIHHYAAPSSLKKEAYELERSGEPVEDTHALEWI